jgi:hypothetical protein
VSIETLAGEDSLTAVVTDAHGQPVLGWVLDASEDQFYGTFCGQTTEPIRFDRGTKLELWVGTWWPTWSPTWWFIPEGVGCFPGVATTGTIRVTLSGWTTSEDSAALSPEPIESPAPESSPSASPDPQSSPPGQTAIERSVDLVLRRHLRGVGSIVAADASCRSAVPVLIERKTNDAWIEIASTTTDADGAFTVRLPDRSGRYRAIAPEVNDGEKPCHGAVSPVVRHRH